MKYAQVIKSNLGILIKELRQENKMSREQLARKTELHINTIYLLENGKIEAKLTTLFFLAKGFDMTLDLLFKLFLDRFNLRLKI